MITEARLSPELPEKFARLYDPSSGKFETPLDVIGVADIDAIFELALWTYPNPENLPEILVGERNIHHVYFTQAWWKNYADAHPEPERQIISEFRDGVPQKACIPIPIHAWIEFIMEPPPPPSIEVMDRCNASWEVASILLKNVMKFDEARRNYQSKKHTNRIIYGDFEGLTPESAKQDFEVMEISNQEYLLSELNRRLSDWRDSAGLIELVPKEFSLIEMPRLSEVRRLQRRLSKKGALLPKGLVELELVA